MKVKILSRKLIKPSTPTPHHLRNFNISFIDEMSPTMNMPLILYYSNVNNNIPKQHSLILEDSLAQVLPEFYPLSGRYNKKIHLIDCSDQGVEYVEAKVLETQLVELLGSGGTKPEQLNALVPQAFGEADEVTDPMMSIQVSEFEIGGGIAIGFCISHRIADASTACTFINAWANASLGDQGCSEKICPTFIGPQLFPGRNLPNLEFRIPRDMKDDVINGPRPVTRRFVFDAKAISSVRAKAVINNNGALGKPQPTRVQLVSGLILRTLLEIDQAKHGHSRNFLALQTVNFRSKTVPPLPKHSCGNLCLYAGAEESSNLDLGGCIDLVSDAIRKTVGDCAKILNSGEDGNMIVIKPFKEFAEKIYISAAGDQQNLIIVNSWCRFPFYEADFGWGKPVWASIASLPARNVVALMDNKDGDGIEAWVFLDEKDMSIFQQDQYIKTLITT